LPQTQQEQFMSNPLTAILEATRVHHDARAAAPDERTRQRITNEFWRQQNQRQQALAVAFGELNGWRLTTCSFFPRDLGTCRRCIYEWMDHPLYYRDAHTRHNIALAGQPYITPDVRQNPHDWLANLKADYAAQGLRCHVPPNAFASFHYPGWTAFLVVTKPETQVQWLPDQIFWRPAPRPGMAA
jgi:hypothetical protein